MVSASWLNLAFLGRRSRCPRSSEIGGLLGQSPRDSGAGSGTPRAARQSMSGRASRARLLAPSFLVVATAIACGQTSGGSDDPEGQGSSPTVGTSGDAGMGAGATGSTTTGTGATGVTAGYAGSSCGGSCNPPAISDCPPTPPQQGSPCAGNVMCQYPSEAPVGGCPGPSTSASCLGGAWNVSVSLTNCNPPALLTCPPTAPTPGSPCLGVNSSGIMCAYSGPTCARQVWCPNGTWEVSSCPPGAGGVPSFGGEPAFGGEPSILAGAGGQGGAP